MAKQTLLKLATVAAILSAGVGCSDKTRTDTEKQTRPAVREEGRKSARTMVSLPNGAGVLFDNNQVVLIPLGNEDRPKYERRLEEINMYSETVGYHFVSIIDPMHKAVYDVAMTEMYPRMRGRIYNMIYDPVSSWASMQNSGSDFVGKYTPDDIAKAQREFAKQHGEYVL